MKNISRILMIIALLCLTVTAAVSCDVIFGEPTPDPAPEHTHELSEVAEVAASCTEAGTKAYYKCSGCDKLFADAEGATEIEAPEAIAALGHTEETIAGSAATCTATGLTEGKKCSVCDATIVAQEEIALLGHSFTNYISNNDATCTEDGTKTAKCDRCDVTDTKADADSAKGHDYSTAWASNADAHWHVCANGCGINGDEAAHTPDRDAATETEAKICTVCKYVIEQATGHIKHNYTVAQHDEAYHWNKCSGCDLIDEKIAHTYTETIITEATCTTTGSKKLSCECGYYKNESIPAKGHDEISHEAKAPTCTDKGWDAYVTCSRCDYTTYAEKAATGAHVYVTETEKVEATCTADGYTIMACGCGATQTTTIPALNHAEVSHEAKAPTCTEKGWDAYVTCSRCDYTTKIEKDALGHAEVSHDAQAPTCTEKGWDAYVTCSRCDYTTYEEKAALGHAEVSHDAQAPTCTEKGWDAYVTCSRCDYTTYVEKAATGHTAKAYDGDCTTPVKCENCDYNVVEAMEAHVASEDDGNCLTAVKCANCDYIVVESTACEACGLCEKADCVLCENKCYFLNEDYITTDVVRNGVMEEKVKGTRYNMNPDTVNGISGYRYTFTEKMTFRIHSTYAPILANDVVYYYLTFKNNDTTAAVEFTYQVEYFGVRGEAKVSIPAGETVEVLLVQAAATGKNNSKSPMNDVIITSCGENGFDITIAGKVSVPKKEIKIEGATINGSNVIGTAYGINTTLDANAEVVYDSTKGTNYGWLYNGLYYETYAEVAKVALDYYTCDTIKAVYAEDFTEKFVPSCRVEARNDGVGDVLPTVSHITDENGALIATRYTAAANENNEQNVQITNGNSESHKDPTNLSLAQLFKSNKNCFLLTFTNNSDEAVSFTYWIDGWGKRGEVTVELAAGETKTVQLVQGYNGSNASASLIHGIKNTNAAAGYDITIGGYVIIR